jgi:hypothetical protein
MTNLIFESNPIAMMIALLVILLLAIEIPYRLGRQSKTLTEVDRDAWNSVQGGLLTLVAFVLGLSYAQAQGRFDARRDLVVREANSIGTTWLRGDQLSPRDAVHFRQILTEYTHERVEAYSTPDQPDLYARVVRDSDRQQGEMWALVSGGLRERPADLGRSLLMTTLNDTIDISSEQVAALTHHVPTPVIALTFLLVVVGAVSIGLQFARDNSRPLTLTTLYVVALALVVNLVIDYDRAQVGFVRVSLDPLLIQLHSMER